MASESIVKCTLKKSAHIAKRLIVHASILIVGIAATIGLTLVIGWTAFNVILPAINKIWSELIKPIWEFIVNGIAIIPWFAWIPIGIVIAILGYSYIWCIARDLTEEDWTSKSANNFAAALAFVAVAFVAVAFAAFVAFAVALAVVAVVALAVVAFAFAAAIDPIDKITIWYYVFRFFGAAWHHYHKKQGEH